MSPFIHSEISSFKILGRPYDIEYPILTIRGDFQDDIVLESVSSDYTSRLETKTGLNLILIPTQSNLALQDGIIVNRSWTILLKDFNDRTQPGEEFSKIRIFINTERTAISIVAMSPWTCSSKMLADFTNYLPKDCVLLWQACWTQLHTVERTNKDLDYETTRSLVILANYIISISILINSADELTGSFSVYDGTIFEGFSKIDLQYLVGNRIANDFIILFNFLFTNRTPLIFQRILTTICYLV